MMRLGRVLELPVSLTVHKMLRVAKCTFFRGDFLLPKVCGAGQNWAFRLLVAKSSNPDKSFRVLH